MRAGAGAAAVVEVVAVTRPAPSLSTVAPRLFRAHQAEVRHARSMRRVVEYLEHGDDGLDAIEPVRIRARVVSDEELALLLRGAP